MMILVTGGAASGKSEFAEEITIEKGKRNLIYIATMIPSDEEETKEKINRHKAMRMSKGFLTVEAPFDLSSVEVSAESTVLLECMSNLLANEMYCKGRNKENAAEEILKGIMDLRRNCKNLIIVTNEVFSDGITYDQETKEYIDNLSLINREIGIIADEVIEVVYSIPVYQKKKE